MGRAVVTDQLGDAEKSLVERLLYILVLLFKRLETPWDCLEPVSLAHIDVLQSVTTIAKNPHSTSIRLELNPLIAFLHDVPPHATVFRPQKIITLASSSF